MTRTRQRYDIELPARRVYPPEGTCVQVTPDVDSPAMRPGGTCYVGTTLSKHPGRRWVVVGWSDDGERCVLAGLPEHPNTPLTEAKGEEARVIKAHDLQEAVDKGVLVAAGGLGAPAVGLVVRGLLEDKETTASVREMLSRNR